MERIRTIDDLLRAKKLTPAEEEQLAEIIQECRVREEKIREASEATRNNLEALSTNMGHITQVMTYVGQAVNQLYEEAEKLQLKMMPENEFYRE